MQMPDTMADPGPAGPANPGGPQITDDLVRKVSDKVLALLLLELRIEQERRHLTRQGAPSSTGGC
jgi:hypothetical protein